VLSRCQRSPKNTNKEIMTPLKNFLAIDLELCTGCRNCELACSARKTNSFNPSRSRIQVLKDERTNLLLPMVCLQCDEPLCQEACPSGALVENEMGILVVDDEACIGCLSCVTACIYGGIALDPLTRKVIKCDLCEGDPACIKACDYDAIKMIESGARGFQERVEGIRTLSSKYAVEEDA
jgi:Fe-S-cluster-containing dehydrogenase component